MYCDAGWNRHQCCHVWVYFPQILQQQNTLQMYHPCPRRLQSFEFQRILNSREFSPLMQDIRILERGGGASEISSDQGSHSTLNPINVSFHLICHWIFPFEKKNICPSCEANADQPCQSRSLQAQCYWKKSASTAYICWGGRKIYMISWNAMSILKKTKDKSQLNLVSKNILITFFM